eukprot:768392-Hanusia_phi.AAC.4
MQWDDDMKSEERGNMRVKTREVLETAMTGRSGVDFQLELGARHHRICLLRQDRDLDEESDGVQEMLRFRCRLQRCDGWATGSHDEGQGDCRGYAQLDACLLGGAHHLQRRRPGNLQGH